MILTMKHIIRRVLLLVVMMLYVVGAAFAGADNGKVYFQKAENFDAYSMGNGKIHFKLLMEKTTTTTRAVVMAATVPNIQVERVYGRT